VESYTVVDVDALEGEGPGGAVRKLRRALGARGFGFNEFLAIGAPLDRLYEPPSWG
jgi:hypothetical protein